MGVKLIAFVGKMGSGKTTAAKYLVFKRDYVRLRFADGLKDMLMLGLGIDKEYIDGEKKGERCEQLCGQTARHAMITLGTEWGRNLIHPDIWVRALAREFFISVDAGETLFVIDDTRFLNESEWIHGLKKLDLMTINNIDAKVIRIIRDSQNSGIQHQSETEQDRIVADSEIHNNGTIADLYVQLDTLL